MSALLFMASICINLFLLIFVEKYDLLLLKDGLKNYSWYHRHCLVSVMV